MSLWVLSVRKVKKSKGQWGTPESFWDELLKERYRLIPTRLPRRHETCCADVETKEYDDGFVEYLCHRHDAAFNARLVWKKNET